MLVRRRAMLSVFGSTTVKEITGVSRMQLQHWETIGLIRPSVRIGSGKGSRREYSFQDLVQLKLKFWV
jgi:DNA-binding transcriptional MerR regulator